MKVNPKVVDISHYDDVVPDTTPGFAAVRKAGYVGVIHKATQGRGSADKMYALRRDPARTNDLEWGAYHYMTGEDPAQQADHFLDVALLGDTAPGSVLFALDHEDRGATLKMARQFCERVAEKAGRYPILYSGFLVKEQMPGASRADQKWWGTNIRLWLSQYGPKPKWPDCWAAPWLWQFTGDGVGPEPHKVPGIKIAGGPDINSFAGTDEELRMQWANGGAS